MEGGQHRGEPAEKASSKSILIRLGRSDAERRIGCPRMTGVQRACALWWARADRCEPAATLRASIEGGRHASHEKRSKQQADAGAKPQKPQSTHQGLRIERT